MCLPVIRETTIPFNGADCLIQLGQMGVRRAAGERRYVGSHRSPTIYPAASLARSPRPDLRADLQIGGYCAPRGNQTVL